MITNRWMWTVLMTVGTLALWFSSDPSLAETATAPAPGKAIAVETTDSAYLEKYGAMLRDERQALERQAERHFASVEKLYDRGLYVIGAILAVGVVVGTFAIGLFYWQFGKTKKELRDEIKYMMKGFAKESVDREAKELRRRLQSLKDEVDDLNAYKSRNVVWVTHQDSRQIEPILRVLRAFDITNVYRLEIRSPDEITLDNPDLVILSFDGTDNGRALLGRIIEQIKHASPPIPLLIFTYNYGGAEIRLSKEDFIILKDFDWYLPTNVPATLLAQTNSLLRRSRDTFRT